MFFSSSLSGLAVIGVAIGNIIVALAGLPADPTSTESRVVPATNESTIVAPATSQVNQESHLSIPASPTTDLPKVDLYQEQTNASRSIPAADFTAAIQATVSEVTNNNTEEKSESSEEHSDQDQTEQPETKPEAEPAVTVTIDQAAAVENGLGSVTAKLILVDPTSSDPSECTGDECTSVSAPILEAPSQETAVVDDSEN